jgi:plastocyanin
MRKLYILFSFTAALISTTASAEVVHIMQSGFTFSPNAVEVNVGDIIHFMYGNGTHTTTSLSVPAGAASWDAPLDAGNTSFEYEVVVAGNYGYHCAFHPNMVGGFTATAPNTIEPILTSGEAATFSAGVDFNTHSLHIALNNFNPSNAVLKMIDITGKEVAVLLNTQLSMGEQAYHFDMNGQIAGIYFLRLEQSGKIVTRKILLN